MADSIAARVKLSRRKCVNVGRFVSRIRQRSEDSLLKFLRTYQIDRSNALGAGQFGTVYSGTNRKNGLRVAVKVVVKAKSLRSIFNVSTLRNEFALLKKLKHPGIIKFEMLSESSKEVFAVMERADGDMLELILGQTNSRLNERTTKFLLRQVLSAVQYLHGRRIAHCDLKPENILLLETTSKFPLVKLCDFGYATKITAGTQTRNLLVGTPAYLAPEVTARTGFNKTLDMWSIGVIIYVTLSGSFPFNEKEQITERSLRPEFLFPPNPWKEIAPEAVDLIQKLLKMNMGERQTAEQCIAHHWLQNSLTYADLLSLERRLGVSTIQQRFLTSEAEDRRWANDLRTMGISPLTRTL